MDTNVRRAGTVSQNHSSVTNCPTVVRVTIQMKKHWTVSMNHRHTKTIDLPQLLYPIVPARGTLPVLFKMSLTQR